MATPKPVTPKKTQPKKRNFSSFKNDDAFRELNLENLTPWPIDTPPLTPSSFLRNVSIGSKTALISVAMKNPKNSSLMLSVKKPFRSSVWPKLKKMILNKDSHNVSSKCKLANEQTKTLAKRLISSVLSLTVKAGNFINSPPTIKFMEPCSIHSSTYLKYSER